MIRKTAFVVSVTVSAFLLVTAGGVLASAVQRGAVQQPKIAAPIEPVVQVAPIMPIVAPAVIDTSALQAQVDEREVAYRALLDQANTRLAESNAEKQRLAEQLKALNATPVPAPASVPASSVAASYAPPAPAGAQRASGLVPNSSLTADDAARVALGRAAGAKLQRAPELVSFEGRLAFEVVLDRGMVYVEAASGTVLYDGTAQAAAASAAAQQPAQPAQAAAPTTAPQPKAEDQRSAAASAEQQKQASEQSREAAKHLAEVAAEQQKQAAEHQKQPAEQHPAEPHVED